MPKRTKTMRYRKKRELNEWRVKQRHYLMLTHQFMANDDRKKYDKTTWKELKKTFNLLDENTDQE